MSRKVTFQLVRGAGGGTASLTVAENIAWPDFVIEAERAIGTVSMKYKYVDSDGDEVNMDTPEELEEAIRWMTRKSKQAVLPDAPVVIPDQQGGDVHCSDGGGEQQELRQRLKKDFILSRAETERLRQRLHGKSPPLFVRHDDVRCDYCDSAVVGIRYKCGSCVNYDLCEACEQLSEEIHTPGHAFIKMRRPSSVAGRTSAGHLVPLFVGSPYEVLLDATTPPHLPLDEATIRGDTAVREIACKPLAGLSDHLRHDLEQINGKISHNELRRSELLRKQTCLRERLGKIIAAAAAAENSRRSCDANGWDGKNHQEEIACRPLAGLADHLRLKMEKVDGKISLNELRRSELLGKQMRIHERLDKVMAAAENCRHRFCWEGNNHQEFERVKCTGKKLDKMHRIGKAVKHEKLVERSKHVCRRAACIQTACRRDEPQPPAAAAAEAAVAELLSEGAEAPEPFLWHQQENQGVVSLRGLRATCEGEETFPNGTKLTGGTKFVQRWMLHNNGSVAWDKYTTLKMAFGTIPCLVDEIILPPLAPGERTSVSIEFEAPYEEGFYRSMWQPCNRGRKFGQDFWCRIMVVTPATSGHESKTPDDRWASGPLRAATIVPERSAFETDYRSASVAVVTAATVAADLVTSAVPKPCEAGRGDVTEPKAGATMASSLHAACDLVHLKMLATSQTATPNNTPLAMSPPKSPEPFAVRTHLANASRRGSSLVSGTAFEVWEPAAESGDKSDHNCSWMVDESDSEDDDFVVVSVPACFNLNVPYVPPDASPSEAAARHAALLPAGSVVSPSPADVQTAGGDDLAVSCRSAVAGDVAAAVSATVVSTTSSARESVQTAVALLSDTMTDAVADTPDEAIGSVCVEQTAIEPPPAAASAGPEVKRSVAAAPGGTVSAAVAATHDGSCIASGFVEEQPAIEPPSVVVPPGNSTASLCESGIGESRYEEPAAEREEAEPASPPVEMQRGRAAGFAGLLTKARDFLGEILKSADQAYTDGNAIAMPAAAHQFAGKQGPLEHGAADSPAAAHLQHLTDAAYDENVPILYPPESPLEQLVAMGFANRPLNTALLQKHNGDIDAVLRELLDELDSDWHTRRH